MKHLFIGGPVDGQFRETENQPYVKVIEKHKFRVLATPIEVVGTIHYYSAHRYREDEKELLVYVHFEFKESIMETLINHYKPFTHQPT